MLLSEGYIKMHRKIVNWQWYTDIPVRILFEHLILTANWFDSKWRDITIRRGQRLTSREHLSLETGLSVRQVRTALEKLQKSRRNNHQNDQQIYACNRC